MKVCIVYCDTTVNRVLKVCAWERSVLEKIVKVVLSTGKKQLFLTDFADNDFT